MPYLLGLDLGTTSIKAVLYDPQLGQVIHTAARPTPTTHPRPGWSEHDPDALWRAAAECIRECAHAAPGRFSAAVSGLAISSMAETSVLVDARGEPLAPAIAWYDRRSEPQAAWIETRVPEDHLYAITGQHVSPSFSVTKLLWTREHLPEAYARGQRWLPLPAYLLYRLTGSPVVDYTIATRALLFDQRRLDWSAELLEAFNLPASLLPPVIPGGARVGAVTREASGLTGLPEGTPCVLGGHDHLCASLALGAHASGAVTDSTGTANALLMLLPNFLPDPSQSHTLAESGYGWYAHLLPGRYAFKGGLKAAGSAIEWLAKQLSPGAEPDYAALEAAAREGIGKRAGPLWLPHLIGSGTPEGDRFSRAALVGAQFEHGPGDLFRGMLESIAFWTRHNLETMQSLTGLPIHTIALTGGVTRLRLLSQLKADCLNRPVLVPQVPETAAVGAALLAGIGTGVFSSAEEAVRSLKYSVDQLDPDPQRAAWYDNLYQKVYLSLYEALKPVKAALREVESQ